VQGVVEFDSGDGLDGGRNGGFNCSGDDAMDDARAARLNTARGRRHPNNPTVVLMKCNGGRNSATNLLA
jgi:hypothetical protein